MDVTARPIPTSPAMAKSRSMQSQARPIRPLLAARALAALVRNPQDTPQVFTIINALRGRSTLRRMQRLRATEAGRRVLDAPRSLLDHLSDRDRLAAMPPDTLGRRYHEFLAEEDLSAQGLATVSENEFDAQMGPEELRFYHRMRDTHDLIHVLTGYGRTPLGEICNLSFTQRQYGGRGIAVIAALGTLKLARDHRGAGVAGAVMEARRRATRAAPLAGLEWEALLNQPLAALRHRMRLGPAPRYDAAAVDIYASRVTSTGT